MPVPQSAKDSWYLSRCTELCLGVSWSVRNCKKVRGIAEDCKIVWSVRECQGAPRSTEQCQYVRVPKIAGICQDVLKSAWECLGVSESEKKCQGVLRSVKECE